jgi:hypothetical protein
VSYTFHEYAGGYFIEKPASGGQLDFRVEAFTGYWVERTQIDHLIGLHDPYLNDDLSSGWSKTKSLTVTYGLSPSPSQTTTQPTNQSATSGNNQQQSPSFIFHPLFLLGVGALVGGVVVAVVLIFTRRSLKNSNYNNAPITN